MNLWDMLSKTRYDQSVRIFRSNAYDQNTIIFNGGSVDEARRDEYVFGHLQDAVDIYFYKGGKLIIMVIDEYSDKRPEEIYTESSIKRWKAEDPKTRPWRTSFEINNGV